MMWIMSLFSTLLLLLILHILVSLFLTLNIFHILQDIKNVKKFSLY